MRPTYSFLRQSFIRFNKDMFEGRLPDVPLRISRGRKTLGCMHFIRKRHPDGRVSYSDFSISVSDAYEREKSELEDILIHEMIHLYEFTQLGGPESAPHGRFFRQEMERINRSFGRHITVRDLLDDETRKTDTKTEVNIIGIILFKDGKKGLTRIAKSRIFTLYDAWKGVAEVERIDWYYTLLNDIKNFRKVQSLKFYPVSEEEASEILSHISTTELEIVSIGGRRHARPKPQPR